MNLHRYSKDEVFILTIRRIAPKELYEKMKSEEKVFLLDVRSEEKYNEVHIEGPCLEACNIPKTHILDMDNQGGETISMLPKEQEIIVTCTTGNSAAKCATALAEMDYNVLVLEGGITGWNEYIKTNK
jgi:rhodanese-related sulfurtransferase